MKKYILGIIIVVTVIFVSGCITNSEDTNTENTVPNTLTQNGISLKYPGTWVNASTESNSSIAAIADPASKDPNSGHNNVNVNIERRDLPSSLESYFNQTYNSLFSDADFTPISYGDTSIGEYSTIECVYTHNDNGVIKKHRAIWIEDNKKVYVILFTSPQDDFENQQKNFDFILSSFRIG